MDARARRDRARTGAADAHGSLGSELGDEAFLRFLDIYLSELPGRTDAIRRAAEQGSAEALRLAAHTLKSTSAALGATSLAGVCEELEALGRSGTTAGAPEQAATIEAVADAVRELLERERAVPEARPDV